MKHTTRIDPTTTSSNATRTYIAHVVIIKRPWWKRLRRRNK